MSLFLPLSDPRVCSHRSPLPKALTHFHAAAGFKAVLVTIDVPYLGRRLNEYRNKFGVPKGMEYPNLFPGVDVSNLEDGDDTMAYGMSTRLHLCNESAKHSNRWSLLNRQFYGVE